MTGKGGRPIRVFHLIKGLGRGGAEMLLADGPARSSPEEFEYAFGYFVPWKDALATEIASRIGEVTCFGAASAGGMFAAVPRVAARLAEFRADIIHCHMPLASVVGRLAGAWASIPVVSTEHNLLERYHPATRFATLATWRMQSHVIAVSAEVSASIARHAGSSVPVTVVRNGVAVDRFAGSPEARRAARAKLGVREGEALVGTVAVFRSQKRLDLWLEAARRLVRSRPVRFVLVGDGPLRSEVERHIARLGLGSAVILPGMQEDVRPFLHAMDAYLMASDFEGLPVALLEAMAAGVVPVVTGVGGIPELVQAGTGFVVSRGDVEGLAAAVDRVLDAPAAERQIWASAARRRVVEEFGTDRMMREIEGIYRGVVSRD